MEGAAASRPTVQASGPKRHPTAHRRAVQRAYEEHARDDDAWVDDTVEHFEPFTP